MTDINFEPDFDLNNGENEIEFNIAPDLFLDPNNEKDLEKMKEIMEAFVQEENYEEAQRIKERIENKE